MQRILIKEGGRVIECGNIGDAFNLLHYLDAQLEKLGPPPSPPPPFAAPSSSPPVELMPVGDEQIVYGGMPFTLNQALADIRQRNEGAHQRIASQDGVISAQGRDALNVLDRVLHLEIELKALIQVLEDRKVVEPFSTAVGDQEDGETSPVDSSSPGDLETDKEA